MSGKKRSHNADDNDDSNNNMIGYDHENRENGSHEEEEEDHDNNNDDDRHGRNNSSNKKRKKSKKTRPSKIMSESGQTDADRRLLRARQRELHNDIAVGGGDAQGDGNTNSADKVGGGDVDELTRLRTQNNDLWRDVRYTREAVLDSENIDLIASKAARQAEKIVQVPRYDAVRVAQALLKKGTLRTSGASTLFNWRGLGFQVGVCFNALPSHVSFLYGPLDAEYIPKERKERAQRRKASQDEDEDEEQPEDVDQMGKKKESDGNELSAVQKHIAVINSTLKDKASDARTLAMNESEEYVSQLEKEHPREDEAIIRKKKNKFVKEKSQVHAVNCLFNPKSFTQTVENVFHFSFLVKDSLAGIKSRSVDEATEYGDVPGPVIRPMKDELQGKIAAPTQAIVSLNMKDWRDMCKAYNVEESHVPHRVDGKVAKKEKKGRKSN